MLVSNHDISFRQQKGQMFQKGFRSGEITILLSVQFFIQRVEMSIHRSVDASSDARDTWWGKAVKGPGLFPGTEVVVETEAVAVVLSANCLVKHRANLSWPKHLAHENVQDYVTSVEIF